MKNPKTAEERREYQRLYRIRHKERLREIANTEAARRKAAYYQVEYALNPVRIKYRNEVRAVQNERNRIRMRERRIRAKAAKAKAEGVES